jgi:hypothetical protein
VEKNEVVTEGHRLIAEQMVNAQRIAERYPNSGMPALLRHIEQTLRALLSHVVDPQPAPPSVFDPGAPTAVVKPTDPSETVSVFGETAARPSEVSSREPVKDPMLKVQG